MKTILQEIVSSKWHTVKVAIRGFFGRRWVAFKDSLQKVYFFTHSLV